jgi:hypothetical protein
MVDIKAEEPASAGWVFIVVQNIMCIILLQPTDWNISVFCIRDQAKSKKALKREAKDAAKAAKKEERNAMNVCFIQRRVKKYRQVFFFFIICLFWMFTALSLFYSLPACQYTYYSKSLHIFLQGYPMSSHKSLWQLDFVFEWKQVQT